MGNWGGWREGTDNRKGGWDGGGEEPARGELEKAPVKTVCLPVPSRLRGGWKGLSDIEGASTAPWREAGPRGNFPTPSAPQVKIRN